MSEIRLDLKVKGTTKTFTQDFVPYRKALEYTEEEAKLWKEDDEGKAIEPTQAELSIFRANFVAGLFDDKDLTGDVILDGIDAEEHGKIMDIILYRVLGYTRAETESPKEKKDGE